jgi:hypothetical protein
MNAQARDTVEKYRARPRKMDDHLAARLRVLREQISSGRISRGDRLTKKLAIAAAVLAVAGILEWLFTPGRIALCLAGLALLAAAAARLQFLRTLEKEFRALARNGHCVLATVIIANSDLFQPGDHPLPAAVVLCFKESLRFDEKFLGCMVEELVELRARTTPPPPDQQSLWAFLRNDYATGLRQVPASISGNAETYVSDLIIDPRILPERRLTEPGLPALLAVEQDVLRMALLHI